jgi:hypothetical protein
MSYVRRAGVYTASDLDMTIYKAVMSVVYIDV